jgi:hypothetical protein
VRVRYGPRTSVFNGGLAVAFVCLFVLYHRAGSALGWAHLGLAALMFAAAVFFPYRDAFRIEDDALVVPAVLGPVARRYPLSEVEVRDGRLWARGKRLGQVPASWLREDEWRALCAHITLARVTRPP